MSEEQELLQETVRSFVEKECPAALARQIFDGARAPAAKLWEGLIEIGVAGLVVPEKFGGAGLGLLELALVSEELGRGVVPVPFLGHALACLALAQGGSAAQRARWLPRLASGEALGAVAFGELVPSAQDAHLFVAARADGTLALVEARSAGLAITPIASNDRGRPLAHVAIAASAGEALPEGDLARLRDAALVLLAADAFGAAHRLIRMTVDYARTRQQFGQPIAHFQALKHQLANMAVELDPTRGLWWYAAHAQDHEPRERAARAAALAKSHVTDRAQQVARDAVECHGGVGFTWECDVQLWFKRILFDRQWLGTPEEHRERIAQMNAW
ncbi:MAG: acyl-CoA dehydrogenase family protein [Myxococcota bacterium]